MLSGAALALSVLLSSMFTAFYFNEAWTTYQNSERESGIQLAAIFSADLGREEKQLIEKAMSTVLEGRAAIIAPDGIVLYGEIHPDVEMRTKDFALESDGTRLGTLKYATRVPFAPPVPYWLAVVLCVAISIMAAIIMRIFAMTVGNYVGKVTKLIGDFSLSGSGDGKVSDFAFAEFRQLALATTRATRRVSGELEHLRASARIDERTGLLNEPAFNREIEKTLTAHGTSALVTIEFQSATQGHESNILGLSNDAHIEAAKRLELFAAQAAAKHGHTNENWVLGSLFSEQFALLIKDCGPRDEVAGIIRELLGDFRVPLRFNQQTLPVALNGSIVILPEDGDTVGKIVDRAQATIEDLKQKDRSGFAFYSPKLERQRDAKVKLETELRQAVAENRFVPLFQPKIDLQTGRISGAEALARWQLENGRLVSPSVFIELAEETGMINKIGEQIMRKACDEAAKWAQEGHRVNLAVNVSPRQFEDDQLSETILDSLAQSGLSPRQFEIEITESLAIQQPERVRAVLEPLRKLGIKLAVDDFGTGHSNLAVLTQLDFDVFKIDRQFLIGTPDDQQANAIVDMILSMASTLEMTIVGEGIETEAQASFLTGRHCNIGQGYLYSPPVTAEAFTDMLQSQPFTPHKLSA